MGSTRVAFLSSEMAPFSKTGGLADVAAALPKSLAELGCDVQIFVPHHRSVASAIPTSNGSSVAEARDATGPVEIVLNGQAHTFRCLTTTLSGTDVSVHRIDAPDFFDRPTVYTDDEDEPLRFIFFCRAVLESCQRLKFAATVFHCNDWQTALVPLFLKTVYARDRLFERSKSLLVIHNLAYQGVFSADIFGALGLEDHGLLDGDDWALGRVNFLKTGLIHADRLATVSPAYAKEIQTAEYGAGLDDLLRRRRHELTGILNGVDYDLWCPRTDRLIDYRYSEKSLWRKKKNKQALAGELGLELARGTHGSSEPLPLVGIVSRLSHQKGIELLYDSLPEFLSKRRMGLVVLGSGELEYEDFFTKLHRRFPGGAHFHRGFSESLAHRVEASSDIFLMPSRYEPCGLNQMYSLRYGTVPVVRKTGGLADSVQPFEPTTLAGTGFVFDDFTAASLGQALDAALRLFDDAPTWRRVQLNGMAQDFSWRHQSQQYAQLYRSMTV